MQSARDLLRKNFPEEFADKVRGADESEIAQHFSAGDAAR